MKYLTRSFHFHIHTLFYIIVGLTIIISTIILNPVKAQAHQNKSARTSATSLSSVTILVLDMSGSMAENDPQGLRCSAANAYIDLSGPGNFIGLIGLDGGNGRGGPHNFEQASIWTPTPIETATLAQRQQLQQTIATRSHNCQPDSSTPTYDALNKAFQMLTSATQNRQLPGSVVLLTDGAPSPDDNAQFTATQSELIPQFKEHNWSIDTIALGQDGPIAGTNSTFHSFLSGLANASGGKFYDDGKGAVSGVSPLNIAPFFVDIFARHNSRIVNNDIPPTPLDGGTTRRNFSVTSYTNNLDVVVVKDQLATVASLHTPDGQTVTQTGSGVFVSPNDPHKDYYEIFSINHPQAGQWEIDVTGAGQFLMDSLKVSGIGLSTPTITQNNRTLAPNEALALGQSFTISASLTFNGVPITDNQFTLRGTIAYTGAAGGYRQDFALDAKNTPGTYTGIVTVPETSAPGSYEILLQASTVSLDAVVASQDRIVRIQAFPVPFFLSPQTRQPTSDPVDAQVIQWDPLLRFLYSVPLLDHLSAWPLATLPAQPYANLVGQVMLHQQIYTTATVNAVANQVGTKNTLPVTIINTDNGHFSVQFPSAANGTYAVTFQTSGSFNDSHGDFGTTQRTAHLTIVAAGVQQETRAWALTLFYLFILLCIILLIRYFILPRPFGEWVCSQEGDIVGRFNYARARRNPLRALLKPDLLYSREANMPKGLLLRFRRGGIEVRPEGPTRDDWQNGDGGTLSDNFREIHELRFRPHEDDGLDDVPDAVTYLLQTQVNKQRDDDDDDEKRFEKRNRRRKSQASAYEDDDYSPRSRGRSRRISPDDDDIDRPLRSRGRRRVPKDDDEW